MSSKKSAPVKAKVAPVASVELPPGAEAMTMIRVTEPFVPAILGGLPTRALTGYYNDAAAYFGGEGVKRFESKEKAIQRLVARFDELGLVVSSPDAVRRMDPFLKAFQVIKAAPIVDEVQPEEITPPWPADVPEGARLLKRYAENEEKMPRENSKVAILLELLRRPEGMSDAEGSAKVGWEGCNITATRGAQRAGFDVYSKFIEGRGTVYYARRPTLLDG